jgi:hypothetical protein
MLGTDEHVNLTAHTARKMVTGDKGHLSELDVSLRNLNRKVQDLVPDKSECPS